MSFMNREYLAKQVKKAIIKRSNTRGARSASKVKK